MTKMTFVRAGFACDTEPRDVGQPSAEHGAERAGAQGDQPRGGADPAHQLVGLDRLAD
jgi:hypothetical protein